MYQSIKMEAAGFDTNEYNQKLHVCFLKSQFLVLYKEYSQKLQVFEYNEHCENLQQALYWIKEKYGLSKDDDENPGSIKEYALLNELHSHLIQRCGRLSVQYVSEKLNPVQNEALLRDLIKTYEFVLPCRCGCVAK